MSATLTKPITDHITYDSRQGDRGGNDGRIQEITTCNTKGIPYHRYSIDTRNK